MGYFGTGKGDPIPFKGYSSFPRAKKKRGTSTSPRGGGAPNGNGSFATPISTGGAGSKKPARKGRLPRQASIPQTLKYPKITRANPLKLSPTEKLLGAGAAVSSRQAIRRVGTAILARGATAITGAGAAVGPALFGGAVAYGLANALLNRYARTREEQQQNAFELAKAYRLARLNIQTKQRRPLTVAQLQTLGNVFKAELSRLGLSSRDLSKLNQSWFRKAF